MGKLKNYEEVKSLPYSIYDAKTGDLILDVKGFVTSVNYLGNGVYVLVSDVSNIVMVVTL